MAQHLVIRKYLSTSGTQEDKQDHKVNLNKSRVLLNELTQTETTNKTVSVLRNHQTETCDYLEQIYKEIYKTWRRRLFNLYEHQEKGINPYEI